MADTAVIGLTGKDFYCVRSLQEIATVNVIGTACINNVHASDEESFKMLIQLNLPSSVNNLIRQLVRPVHKSVKDWYSFQFSKVRSATSGMTLKQFVAKHGFHFMWCGVVDFDRMAMKILHEESLPIAGRFEIACEYSSPGDIYSLWARLSPDEREDITSESDLVRYWKAVLKGNITGLPKYSGFNSEKRLRMDAALRNGNLSSIRYFWNLLKERDRSAKITEFAEVAFDREHRIEEGFFHPCIVPFFLLESRSKELLSPHDSRFKSLLIFLSTWPWQDLFITFVDFTFSDQHSRIGTPLVVLLDMLQNVLSRLVTEEFVDPRDRRELKRFELEVERHSFTMQAVLLPDMAEEKLSNIWLSATTHGLRLEDIAREYLRDAL